MRLTNLSRILILGTALSYCALGIGVTKLPFLLFAGAMGGLMVAVVFSRTAEHLFFEKESAKANHRLAAFALGAVLLFGVFGFATMDVEAMLRHR